jgi:hypothetical protein
LRLNANWCNRCERSQPIGYPHPDWHYTNQTGFLYQAQAVHRCAAAGLRECPQFTKADSLHMLAILDGITANEITPKL